MTGCGPVDLAAYDLIVVNSSGGKDSQATLDVVACAAIAAGVPSRLVVAHADLGRMEWPGTRELVVAQAAHYDVRCEVTRREITGADGVRRPQDLLEHIEARGQFPDAARRYCTSDHKRGPIQRLITSLVGELGLRRQARVLSVMGMRADESPARARRAAVRCPGYGSSGRRLITEWLPLHTWTVEDVWARIALAGSPTHPAYALGMPRLSCRFCVLASRSALERSAQLNPELAAEYAAAILELAKTWHWLHYHTWSSQHSAAGFPDLVLVRGIEIIFAELKTTRGRVSGAQHEWVDALAVLQAAVALAGELPAPDRWGSTRATVDVYVWRPADWPFIEQRLGRGPHLAGKEAA